MRLGTLGVVFVSLLLVREGLSAQIMPGTPWPRLRTVLVTRGLDLPLDIQSARDGSGRLFVVEQPGRIRIVQNGQLLATPFLDIREKVRSGGERGLLGLAFSPNYKTNGTFYVNYTEGTGAPDLRTIIARYKVNAGNPNVADPASEERLLVVNQPFDNHNGGGLAFSPRDGYLYIGLGDGGSGGDPQNNAQNPSSRLGKLLRMNVEAQSRPPVETWATGLRNPWRFTFDRNTQDLWIADVGQGQREEVNFQPADAGPGLNYGWNIWEGNRCYQSSCSANGYVMPVFDYDHTLGFSVTGGYIYRGFAQMNWCGTYLLADYVSGRFWGIRRENRMWMVQQLTQFSGTYVTGFGEDEDGELFVTHHSDAPNGAIYRLVDVTPLTRGDLVVNAATGQPGAVPGARINIYGWGIAVEPKKTQVLFDGVAAEIAIVETIGGQELIVAVVPPELAGREKTSVVVVSGEERSEPVEVNVPRVQPGVFDLSYEAVQGGFVDLEVTGLSTCSVEMMGLVGGASAPVAGCRPSEWFAGAYRVTVQVPDGMSIGDGSLRLVADGVESPEVRVRIR